MSEIHPIYSFDDYRLYLEKALESDQFGRGSRKRLAEFLNCQSSFISQVFSGKSELSLEHAYQVSQFLKHEQDESHYFMTLVQLGRAGSHQLEGYFRSTLNRLRDSKLQVQEVLKNHELSESDVLDYYGNWLCLSIHMLISIRRYQNVDVLREKLQATESEFQDALRFLTRTGLVVRDGERLLTGESKIHLKKTSPYAQVASVLTRQKVLEKLRIKNPDSLNYTHSFTMSKAAHLELKRRVLQLIGEIDELIDQGEPESFHTVILDLIEH